MENQVLSVIEGFYHGLVFSFPFSVPILICVSRFLLQGFFAGLFASLGTLFGQLCFFFLILNGTGASRSFIHLWYTIEPFLAFLGFLFSFKLAADFMSGGSSSRRTSAFRITGTSGTTSPLNFFSGGRTSFVGGEAGPINCFLTSFCLMFLNPSMGSTSSRMLLAASTFFEQKALSNAELRSPPLGFLTLDGGTLSGALGGSSGGAAQYIFGFFVTFLFFVLVLWPLMITLIVGKGASPFPAFDPLFRVSNTGVDFGQGQSSSRELRSKPFSFSLSPSSYEPIPEARILLSFLLVGCLMSGGFQYSWRLFTQYPVSFIEGGSAGGQALGASLIPPPSREFPSFDSNIQHREKNLPLDRHLPVDKMNSRRILSGRPPLSEQQKADASLKFQSFFLNTLEEKIENQLLKYRDGERSLLAPLPGQRWGGPSGSSRNTLSPNDLSDFLITLKNQGRSYGFFGGRDSKSPEAKPFLGTSDREGAKTTAGLVPAGSELALPRPLQNNTKGKPKYSYIQSDTLPFGNEIGLSQILHDEFQVYGALFARRGA